MEPEWLAAEDEALLRAVDEAMGLAEYRASELLDYRRGCPTCCLGPFPVNRLDALRLRRGLAALAARHPQRAQAIAAAAASDVRALAPSFPGDGGSGRLSEDEAARERFFTREGGRPCPALDLRSGSCQLYAARPLTCRTFGAPVRFGGRDLEACQICFRGSREDEDACRVEPDAGGLEDAILDKLEAGEGEQGETIIAYVLARPLL